MPLNLKILILMMCTFCVNHNVFSAEKKYTIQDFYSNNKQLIQLTDSIYNTLNNKQRAAQMIMYAVSNTDNIYTYSNTRKLLQDTVISNVVFLKGYIDDIANQIKDYNLLNNSFKNSYACDCEPSLFNMKYFGSPKVEKSNLLSSDSLVLNAANIISNQLSKIGIHINFAPVVDNAFNTAVVNHRSFGINNNEILNKATRFIDESTQQNIATSIKHFPGHGNVSGDSHKNLVYINGEMEELPIFYNLIQAVEPIFTMIGHIAIRNNASFNTNEMPSSISKNIVTDLLKKNLGFEGIAITDAMNMLGVAKIPDADFKAVEAGNDIVLMPMNPRKLSEQLIYELDHQTELSYQLENSIKKIIKLKVCLEN